MNALVQRRIINERVQRLKRGQTDLYWLCTEVLGLTLLTEAFHKPMLEAADRLRVARLRGAGKHSLWIWPRDHYKTSCRMGQTIQDLLWDPLDTITWWHKVEEMAQDACEWIGKQLQYNKELRRLFPPTGVLPSEHAKRFIGRKEFNLPCNKLGAAPTLRAWGVGSTATGGHSRRGKLDDPIDDLDVRENQMGTRWAWYENTVLHVVRSDGWLDGSGTRWDINDMYSKWLASPYWESIVRSARETNGSMDYKGTSVLLPEPLLRRKETEGRASFPAQMMNDPSPAGEKPWGPDCEHIVSRDEASKGWGYMAVFSDPAPAQVEEFEPQEAKGLGGEKNYWGNAVVKFRVNGQRSEAILIDGSLSREWGVQDGFRDICRLVRKWHSWGCAGVAVEKTGQAVAFYIQHLQRVAMKEGVSFANIDLTQTYEGKNRQFRMLADKAKQGEFLICEETCDPAFLAAFLDQARNWRPVGKKNSLKFDDAANAVSFAMDPAMLQYAPMPLLASPDWNESGEQEQNAEHGRSRYSGI